jgi:cytochrome P450 family 142 subfamily A polypeptide 1
LRDESPVHWDPVQRIWGVSRHADVLHVEKHTAQYSSFEGSRPRLDQREDTSMINRNDPEHQQQRMLVARRFTPRGVRSHEDRVRELATAILDDVIGNGGCEAVEAIASRLPAMVIGEMLGYPREMWPLIRKWSEVTMYQAGQTRADGGDPEQSDESLFASSEFAVETMKVIAQRRADPQDDLISVWAHTEVDGRVWTDAEVLAETILVLDGGAETTRTVIGAIVRELALRPDQRRLLLEQPDLLAGPAVEEFIRWVSPILNMRRTVTEDHELHGQELRTGDEMLLLYGAANRDERAFADPETFDVTRPVNHHVAFGFGTHFCLGASLARLELRVMFEELLRRIPDWRLAPGHEPTIVPAVFARAYDEVHIEFGG